jgi:hypothetical protein
MRSNKCRGAGAARIRIILVELEPEPQREAASPMTASAPNLISYIGGLSKMSQTVTVYSFHQSVLYQFKSEEVKGKTFVLSFLVLVSISPRYS